MSEAQERFQRVILPRVEKAVHAVKLIANGAAKNYEATPDEVEDVLRQLRETVAEVEAAYAARYGVEKQITTPAPDAPEPAGSTAPPPAPRPVAPETMRWNDIPKLVMAIPDTFVPAVVTQLVNRMSEAYETRKEG